MVVGKRYIPTQYHCQRIGCVGCVARVQKQGTFWRKIEISNIRFQAKLPIRERCGPIKQTIVAIGSMSESAIVRSNKLISVTLTAFTKAQPLTTPVPGIKMAPVSELRPYQRLN